MNQQFSDLESRIRPSFEALSAKVESTERPIIPDIGFSKNDYFPLRAWLSFIRDKSGDEVAVTVDIWKDAGRFVIRCEFSKGEGQILAEMRPLSIEMNAPTIEVSTSVDRWFESFEGFLVENFEILRSAVHSL